jgi:hypothetical protein
LQLPFSPLQLPFSPLQLPVLVVAVAVLAVAVACSHHSAPKHCHPERNLSRTLREVESKDLRLFLLLPVLILNHHNRSGAPSIALLRWVEM